MQHLILCKEDSRNQSRGGTHAKQPGPRGCEAQQVGSSEDTDSNQSEPRGKQGSRRKHSFLYPPLNILAKLGRQMPTTTLTNRICPSAQYTRVTSAIGDTRPQSSVTHRQARLYSHQNTLTTPRPLMFSFLLPVPPNANVLPGLPTMQDSGGFGA